jgi:hypothetical protein
MLHSTRQTLMFLCCTVIVLDIMLLLGGPSLLSSVDETSDWLYSEFEFEENEDCDEDKTLIQDVEFLVEYSHSGSLLIDVDFSINESDRNETHVSRGPPVLC